MLSSDPVWLITGCSTGFGRELAAYLLAHGHRVAATARRVEDVADLVEGHGDRALALRLDVMDAEQIDAAVTDTLAHFGQLDVLVNNAGIGYFAAVEESDEDEVRRMFEINVFGLARMTQAVLPSMRAQKSGHVVNVSSIGGFRGFPTVGFYNATKFAVNGLSEALAVELAPLGIGVTIVMPSGFRTDWAGRSANEAPATIADYAPTAHRNTESLRTVSGRQAGDPKRAAQAIVAAVTSEHPPLHLLLGAGALHGARGQLDALTKDFDAYADVSVWCDAPEGAPEEAVPAVSPGASA